MEGLRQRAAAGAGVRRAHAGDGGGAPGVHDRTGQGHRGGLLRRDSHHGGAGRPSGSPLTWYYSRPRRAATATAWARVATPSLLKTVVTWYFAVRSATTSCAAISLL